MRLGRSGQSRWSASYPQSTLRWDGTGRYALRSRERMRPDQFDSGFRLLVKNPFELNNLWLPGLDPNCTVSY